MAYGSSKINRYNMHQLPPYERMQYQRERRAMAAETAQKQANMANSFANIQSSNVVETGNIVSKIAMSRMSKIA
ncbi:hypothetical protein SAMN06295905_1799 [Devosia lucknowensis]|uniref:Uncharacterized protein n=2 Tax=Devosia lucknowensis TaxID=1096929 RepID=A0A1Y6F978_9HYPH|nr:hypothetical protein SAMN06295905_1799 [Devosia lucknowensis]